MPEERPEPEGMSLQSDSMPLRWDSLLDDDLSSLNSFGRSNESIDDEQSPGQSSALPSGHSPGESSGQSSGQDGEESPTDSPEKIGPLRLESEDNGSGIPTTVKDAVSLQMESVQAAASSQGKAGATSKRKAADDLEGDHHVTVVSAKRHAMTEDYDDQINSEIISEETTSMMESDATDRPLTPSTTNMFDADGNLKLRDYQKEISKNILKGKNDIIVLPTGTGKTEVALNLMLSRHLPKNHATVEAKKKVLYTVPNKVLALQQYERIKRAFDDAGQPYQVKMFCGGINDDIRSGVNMFESRKKLLEGSENDVLVITPQILVNYFLGFPGEASLSHFSLIIIDECHKAHSDGDPTHKLLKCYHQQLVKGCSRADLPQMVGLTATPTADGDKDLTKATKSLVKLFALFDMKQPPTEVRENINELERFTANPTSHVTSVNTNTASTKSEFIQKLQSYITEHKKFLKDELTVNGDYKYLVNAKLKVDSIKPEASYEKTTSCLKGIIDLIKLQCGHREETETFRCVKSIKHIEKLAEARLLALLCPYTTACEILREKICDHAHGGREQAHIDLYDTFIETWLPELKKIAAKDDRKFIDGDEGVHDGLHNLKQKIQEEFEEDKNTKMMIFTHRRDVCRLLSEWINSLKDEGNLYKSHRLVSDQAATGEERMSREEQKETVKKFRNGEYNILVATEIGELGLDIPACKSVISYMYTKGFNSITQMKGRCRARDGQGKIHWIVDAVGAKKVDTSEEVNSVLIKALEAVRGENWWPNVERERKEIAKRIEREEEENKKLADAGKNTTIHCEQCKAPLTSTRTVKRFMESSFIPFDKGLRSKIYVIKKKEEQEQDTERLNGMTAIGRVYCSGKDEKCSNHLGKAWFEESSQTSVVTWKLEKVLFKIVTVPGREPVLMEIKKWTILQNRFKYFIEIIDYPTFASLLKEKGFELTKRDPGCYISPQIENLIGRLTINNSGNGSERS